MILAVVAIVEIDSLVATILAIVVLLVSLAVITSYIHRITREPRRRAGDPYATDPAAHDHAAQRDIPRGAPERSAASPD